ncbi:MAG: hypothetical protein RR594_06805 [Clostridia bacterium]
MKRKHKKTKISSNSRKLYIIMLNILFICILIFMLSSVFIFKNFALPFNNKNIDSSEKQFSDSTATTIFSLPENNMIAKLNISAKEVYISEKVNKKTVFSTIALTKINSLSGKNVIAYDLPIELQEDIIDSYVEISNGSLFFYFILNNENIYSFNLDLNISNEFVESLLKDYKYDASFNMSTPDKKIELFCDNNLSCLYILKKLDSNAVDTVVFVTSVNESSFLKNTLIKKVDEKTNKNFILSLYFDKYNNINYFAIKNTLSNKSIYFKSIANPILSISINTTE